MKQLTLFLLSFTLAFTLNAQDVYDFTPLSPNSSVRPTDSIASFDIKYPRFKIAPLGSSLVSDTILPLSFRRPYILPHPGTAVIAAWDNGAISANGSTAHMPGLMGIERGNMNFGLTIGRMTYNIYGEAIKYGYFNGLQTSYGFGADATYHFSDKLSITLFASYYSPLRRMPHAATAYISTSNFGGYFDYSFSNRFGVQVGAQSYRSSLTHRWETQPIVKPYYKISSKASIGVDVGGIIYQLLKSNVGNNSWGPKNPTIGPPVMKMSEMMGY